MTIEIEFRSDYYGRTMSPPSKRNLMCVDADVVRNLAAGGTTTCQGFLHDRDQRWSGIHPSQYWLHRAAS